MKKTFLLINFILVGLFFLKSQTQQITPNGYFDTLIDQHGNKHALKNLLINPGPNPDPEQTAATSVSCTAGYFRLYFAVGSGFDGNSTNEINRRAVLCQLFTDLSCFIRSPLSSPCITTTNTNVFVNVLVDNNPGGLASGTTMFAVPPNPAIGACIQDNLAFKTINSGIDAYTNVTPPIIFNPGFYHMIMKFNTNAQWYLDMTSITNILPNQYDLYSAGLHEALHCLGFATLIGPNGAPLNGNYNFYSRYDLRLKASNGITPLLTTTNTSCSFSSMQWNPVLPTATTLKPGNCINPAAQSNNTGCGTSCKYVSSSTSMTVPLYTPNCYEPGGSLSHFEDQCYPSPPAGNDQYFLMSNAYGGPNNGIKRYPREEEKVVLCDIGYSVAPQYLSPVAGAPFTYTSGACNPPSIWGINDGIVNNTFVFTGSSQINIPITSSVLANDSPNAVQADCISFVYNYPQLQLSITGGSIVITYTPGPIQCPGLVLLQYIPKDASGNPGNITYIYAYFQCGNCGPLNPCNLVQNGGFENLNNPPLCGGVMTPAFKPNCWEIHTNNTPDIFTGVPTCASNPYHLSQPFVFSQFAINNTYNGPTNYHTVGLTMKSGINVNNTNTFEESIKTDLGTPLAPTQTYVLSFWAFNSKAFNNALSLPSVITFATRQNAAIALATNYPTTFDNVIANFTLSPSDFNTWKNYTTTVVFSSPNNLNHKCLIVGLNPTATAVMNNNVTMNDYYTFIDDVSLVDLGNALIFGPPSIVCDNSCLQNLGQYANQANVVFSGPFVTQNSNSFDFCPSGPGNYTIVASYTNNVGCSYTTQAVIAVPGLTIIPSNTLFCNYLNYTLTAAAIPSNIASPFPLWQPQNINASQVVVSGNVQTTYLASSSIGGCPLLAAFDPTIVPNSIITATPDIWCATPNAAYSMSVSLPNFSLPIALTQTWSPPINSTNNPVSVSYSNVVNPTYSVFTSAGGCTNIATYTATWVPTPTIAILGGTNCLTPNQTVTLQAISSSTLPLSYTWQPNNVSTSSIIITPSATTIYSLLTSYSSCAFSSTIDIYPAPQFTNVPTSLCSGQPFNYLQDLLATGTPTTGTFSGVGTYTSLVGSQILTSFSVPINAIIGPYPIVYSYLTPAGCFATNTFVINVVQGVSVTVVNPNVTYCANIAVGATLQAIATPSTGVSYTWNPGNVNTSSFVATPSVNTSYSIVVSLGTCSAFGRAEVTVSNSCCPSSNYINTSIVSNQTLTGLYAINQDITIFGSVVLGGEFLIAPNVSITVVPGATLTSNQGANGTVGNPLHLRACTNMWEGIQVQNGGKVLLWQGDLIEDAKNAIVSDGCTTIGSTDISLLEVAFNRNDNSVVIRNYNQATNSQPFDIQKCVFTCRDLNISFYSLTWPTAATLKFASGPTNVLASPYTFAPFNPAFLLPPINNRPSLTGITVDNSGITSNPTATNPVYFSININADNTANSTNFFDNLLIGIFARNSNLNSYNNLFQNTRRIQIGPFFGLGFGIFATNDDNGTYKNTRLNMVTTNSATTLPNTFYNCHFGIYTNNLFELNCQYQDFRSTQSSAVAFNNNLTGQFAIYSIGNRFKRFEINYNKIQNIRTGVYLASNSGPLNLPSIPNFGLYLGKINVTYNFISPTILPTAAIGNGYVYYGVYATGILGSNTSNFYEPNSALRIQHNDFNRVWRGVYMNNFSNSTFTGYTANNRITMVFDNQNPVASQYGIQHVNNFGDVVNTNTIIGTGATLLSARTAGIYKSLNSTSSTQCNSVVSVYSGFRFEGNNVGAFWRRNIMNNNSRGLQLNTNAILSQQGTASAPSDNVWQGSWVGRNGTWTDNSTFPTGSPLAIRTLATYLPPNNANQGSSILQTYLIGPGTVIFANNNAPFSPCYPATPPCTNCNPSLVASLNSIVTGEITYSVVPQETEEINRDLVYRDITIEPQLRDSSQVLSEFYVESNTSTSGQLQEADANIRTGNFNLVTAILNAINPNSNIELNNKLFLNLNNAYVSTGTLSVSDRLALFVLAHQCPFTDGVAVYKARGLLSMVSNEVNAYNDNNCIELGFSFRSNNDSSDVLLIDGENINIEHLLQSNESKNIKKKINESNYNLYPNPASDVFVITSNKESEKISVKITDVSGRLLNSKNVILKNNHVEVSTELVNGVYFITITNESGEKLTTKLIISK